MKKSKEFEFSIKTTENDIKEYIWGLEFGHHIYEKGDISIPLFPTGPSHHPDGSGQDYHYEQFRVCKKCGAEVIKYTKRFLVEDYGKGASVRKKLKACNRLYPDRTRNELFNELKKELKKYLKNGNGISLPPCFTKAITENAKEIIKNNCSYLKYLKPPPISRERALELLADEMNKHFDRTLWESPIELPEDWLNDFQTRYYYYGLY